MNTQAPDNIEVDGHVYTQEDLERFERDDEEMRQAVRMYKQMMFTAGLRPQLPVHIRGNELLARLPDHDPCRAAEVGVWHGELSEYLLMSRSNLQLVMVDLWNVPDPDGFYARSGAQMDTRDVADHLDAYRQAHERTRIAGTRATMMRLESVYAAYQFAPESFDVVFLDADHQYEAVRADLGAWWRTVRIGGWIGGHDWGHPPYSGVAKAVMDWSEEEELPMEWLWLGANKTWWVRRVTPTLLTDEAMRGRDHPGGVTC